VASTHQKENYTTLIYQDFIGIDLNRNRDKVFGSTKGSTTTPAGLGLYLVKSQVEAMGGINQ
jgi:sensor histidine kinase regulating citrate/malate metabolism